MKHWPWKRIVMAVGLGMSTVSSSIAANPLVAVATSSSPSAWSIGPANKCPGNVRVVFPTHPDSFYVSNPGSLGEPPGAPPNNSPLRSHIDTSVQRGSAWLHSVTCKPRDARNPVPPGPRSVTYHGATDTSINWSGYEEAPTAGETYDSASLQWVIPPVNERSDLTVVSSIWPGLGSGSNVLDSLAQAGTDQNGACEVGCLYHSTTYDFWYEVYPEESSQTISMSANPGDTVVVEVGYNTNGGIVTFYFDDLTTNQTATVQQILGAYESTGNQAEFILERTESCGIGSCTYPSLMNFGTEQMTTPEATENIGGTDYVYHLTTTNPAAFDMWDCPSDNPYEELALTNSVQPDGSFSISWLNWGVTDPAPNC